MNIEEIKDGAKTKKVILNLTNDQNFHAEIAVFSKNRYFDGKNWLYFETEETTECKIRKCQFYHRWTLKKGGSLTAWLIPIETCKNVSEIFSR